MRIRKVKLQNFQCFGPKTTEFLLDDTSVLIGANGTGKTAVLQALSRVFGSSVQRELTRTDFHVPIVHGSEEPEQLSLRIEVELEVSNDDDIHGKRERAGTFGQVIIVDEGGALYLRAVLEATWTASSDPDGSIDTNVYWACVPDEQVPEDKQLRMRAPDRAQIQVHYVPAVREPGRQLKNVSGSTLHRLLKAVKWSDGAKTQVTTASESAGNALLDEPGLQLLNHKIDENWKELHSQATLGKPSLQFLARTLSQLLSQTSVAFGSEDAGESFQIEHLSDGQRSLFYLCLIRAVFSLECDVVASSTLNGTSPEKGSAAESIPMEDLKPAVLTLFAIEEPENHLSPHFLGRVVEALKRLSSTPMAQVVITTHSPSIMSRIEPNRVRHLRLGTDRCTIISSIPLPPGDAAEAKFVREAVISYPELYFADLVVLGEGDSEEVVLPRLLKARGVSIDPSRISIVPLGGRFVHHFWRLLLGLQIPFITLLDLDLGRFGGGWGRIKYVCTQLSDLGVPWQDICRGLVDASGSAGDDHSLKSLHLRTDFEGLENWRLRLENYNVFFSNPLDLDFSMLRSFEDSYKTFATDVSFSTDPTEREKERKGAILAVLKKKGDASNYSDELIQFFPWYNELFLINGKPVTHIQALSALTESELVQMPEELDRLCARVVEVLGDA